MSTSMDDLRRLSKRMEDAKTDQATYRSHVQESAELCKPRGAKITSEGIQGEKRSQKQYFGIAEYFLGVFSSGLINGVFPPGGSIFRLSPRYPDDALREWGSHVEDVVHALLHSSNLDNEAHEAGDHFGYAGQAFTFCEEHDHKMGQVRFSTRPIREWVALENRQGEVDTVFREYKLPAREIAKEWPNHKCDQVHQALTGDAQQPDKKFTIKHAVYPRQEGRSGLLVPPSELPFASIYWVDAGGNDGMTLLEDGGFHEFPGAVARISKEAGEDTGRGPGMRALGDIKQNNLMWRTLSRRGEMESDPPWMVASHGLKTQAQRKPGANIIFDPTDFTGNMPPITPLNIGGGGSVLTVEMLRMLEDMLKRGFYSDVFMPMPTHGDMRVDQVREIRRQALRGLGGILGRVTTEYMVPLMNRTIGISMRAGVIMPPPESIGRNTLDIEWTSPLLLEARSQDKEYAIQQAYAWLDSRYQATQDPSVYDMMNMDRASRVLLQGWGVPGDVENNEATVAAMREQRAAVQAEQQKKQDAMMQLGAAKEMAQIGKEASGA